jgi:UDP-glucose 4-epimerase
LREPGVHLTVMDSLDPHLHSTTEHLKSVWDQIRFIRGDIRDEHILAEIVQGQNIIYNCAAQTSHPLSIQYPVLDAEINCIGNLRILESIRLLNPQATIVFTSSSSLIGKATQTVIDEDHGEKPLEMYSANKGVAEKYYRIYHTLHDLKTVVLRFANLYGPFGKNYPEFGFINYFISQSWRNECIKIYGAGDQLRNIMFVEDAVDILWIAAQKPNLYGQILFATGDSHLSVREIAKTVVNVMGRGEIQMVDWPNQRKRIELEGVKFSSERLRSLTGWKPKWEFKEGLTRTKEILVDSKSS